MFFEILKKYISALSILELIILTAGYGITFSDAFNPPFTDIVLFSGVFYLNTGIALFVFFRGQTRDPESQTFHSLVAVSLKFLVELAIIFICFIIAKKNEMQSVVLFFVLYLSFTLFFIFKIFKTLKIKSL